MDVIIQIIAILAVAKIFGEILEHFGYPSLIGEITAGILLGPAVLNLVAPNSVIELLSEIGVIALLFVSGVEMNVRLLRASERIAAATAVGGVVVPFSLAVLFGYFAGFTYLETLFFGIALSITSIGISVRTLVDLRQLNSVIGTTIIGAAVFDDVIGIVMIAVLSSFAAGTGYGFSDLLVLVLVTVLFFVLTLTAGRAFMIWVFEKARKTKTHEMTYSVAIILALLTASLAQAVGLHYAIGAFLAGIILGDQIRKDRVLFDSLLDFAFGFFVTIFFASIGLLITLSGETLLTPLIIPTIIIAFAGKILGGYAGSVWFVKERIKALLIGIGLVPRGEITLVVIKIALLSGLISGALYTSMTLMVMVTMFATPLLMQRSFRRLKEKDLQVADHAQV